MTVLAKPLLSVYKAVVFLLWLLLTVAVAVMVGALLAAFFAWCIALLVAICAGTAVLIPLILLTPKKTREAILAKLDGAED